MLIANFAAYETFTLTNDNTFTVNLSFTFEEEEKAMFEWQAGAMNPYPFIGNKFDFSDGKETKADVVPLRAKSEKTSESMIAQNWKSLKFDSRIGKIEITTTPGNNATLIDYRKNRWAVPTKPIFWFGILETMIENHQTDFTRICN